jgi:hypothetical protein
VIVKTELEDINNGQEQKAIARKTHARANYKKDYAHKGCIKKYSCKKETLFNDNLGRI